MFYRSLGMILMAMATAASAQTLYRTVTGSGKVVYSDTPVANDSATRPSQTRTYSSAELGAANIAWSDSGGASAGSGSQPCRADAQKYCGQAAGKQAMDCLLDHQQDISDACYDALKKRLQSGQDGRESASAGQGCKQDAQQLCAGIEPGGGRIVNCLLDHQQDISDTCYKLLATKMKGQR